MDTLKLTYKDKFMLYSAIDGDNDTDHPYLELVSDTRWVSVGWDSLERTVEVTDGTGFYKLEMTCGGDPYYDPSYHWERLPDEIAPYKGKVNNRKKLYTIHAKEYTSYSTFEVWALNEEEARSLVESDPSGYQVDSETDSNWEIISIEEGAD